MQTWLLLLSFPNVSDRQSRYCLMADAERETAFRPHTRWHGLLRKNRLPTHRILYNIFRHKSIQKFGGVCGATSFLRNSDKIYEKKRNASQAPGRRFWPSAAARTRTRSWRPLWTRWWPPGSLIVRSVGWRWTTRPTPCDCYCSKWGGM